jgi:hypothetical protein
MPFRWLLDRLAERVSELPGAQLASAQLAQLLFIQILRAHLAALAQALSATRASSCNAPDERRSGTCLASR